MKRVTDFDKRIGNNLRNARLTAGITQEDAGKYVGVTFQQIQNYEKGANRISVSKFYELCDLYGAKPNKIARLSGFVVTEKKTDK